LLLIIFPEVVALASMGSNRLRFGRKRKWNYEAPSKKSGVALEMKYAKEINELT